MGENNRTLTEIDLRFNQLAAQGVSDIAEVLGGNTVLAKLELSNNQFGDEGMCALAAALKINTSITNCQVVQNDFGCKGTLAVADMIQTNETLEVFNMHLNRTEEDGETELRKQLKRQDHMQ